MVATLYRYRPGPDGRTLKDGVREVIMNQDTAVAASARLAAANAKLREVYGADEDYLKEEAVFGLPTGGELTADGNMRVYARDEVRDIA